MSIRLLANVGAEEPLPARPPPAAACAARLFRLLFARDALLLDAPDAACDWPAGLGPAPSHAAYPWLDADTGVFAWLNTDAAARAALEAGLPLLGPAPEIVRRVHDKAFAARTCREEGLEPRSLRGLVTCLGADELRDPEAVLAGIRDRVRSWPAWTRRRFTLKPRLGGSGRGRVGGALAGDALDAPDSLRRALPRLARQGGALLEPWLEREIDLSAQLHVAPDGTVTLLATFEQRVSPSGVYRGHRGRIDHRFRVTSGSRFDGELLEAALVLARAAHAAGFHGPCGVDAFVFRGERGAELRAAVELNARFTMGTVVAGLLRRARPEIEARLPAPPGETRGFEFRLAAPAPGWPEPDPPSGCGIPLGTEEAGIAPALLVTRET